MSKKTVQPSKPTLRRPVFIVFFVFLIGVSMGLFFREELFSLPGLALVRNDDLPSEYDHIVVLMGDGSGRRAKAATQLWKKNQKAQVLYVREKPEGFVAMGLAKGRDESHTGYFLQAGVPSTKLLNITECLTTSTIEEALCLQNFFALAPRTPTTLVIVTDWYHSSRAGWLFEKIFATTNVKIILRSAASDDPIKGVRHWWKDEEMFLRVFEEYIKWTYWRAKSVL